jgi:hypothetical protein
MKTPKSEKRYQPYFSVSGGTKVVEAEVRILPPRVRFESLSLKSAEEFATLVYRNENIVLEIHEVTPSAPLTSTEA